MLKSYQANGQWDESAEVLAQAAENLEKAGADFVLICTNTMHKVAPQVQSRIHIPLVHIAEATADALKENNISKVGLLGTKYTMTQEFYKNKLIEAGIDVLIPEGDDINIVNDIIYNELCLGDVKAASKKEYLRIIENLKQRGAQGVILGCTEIGLLIQQQDTELPVFDTTQIHATKAALLSIEK